MTSEQLQDRLLFHLRASHRGRNKAVSGAALTEHFEQNDTKRIREAVNALRRAGIPVCSDESGYWYPLDRADAAASIHHLTVLFAPLRQSFEGFMAGLSREFGDEQLPFETEGVMRLTG